MMINTHCMLGTEVPPQMKTAELNSKTIIQSELQNGPSRLFLTQQMCEFTIEKQSPKINHVPRHQETNYNKQNHNQNKNEWQEPEENVRSFFSDLKYQN